MTNFKYFELNWTIDRFVTCSNRCVLIFLRMKRGGGQFNMKPNGHNSFHKEIAFKYSVQQSLHRIKHSLLAPTLATMQFLTFGKLCPFTLPCMKMSDSGVKWYVLQYQQEIEMVQLHNIGILPLSFHFCFVVYFISLLLFGWFFLFTAKNVLFKFQRKINLSELYNPTIIKC